MEQQYAIELRGITKRFGSVVANNGVNLNVRPGEILALLGENGSGKTTLMNMLSGIYKPDSGQIFVDGKEVSIDSPEDAKRLAESSGLPDIPVNVVFITELLDTRFDPYGVLRPIDVSSVLEAQKAEQGEE